MKFRNLSRNVFLAITACAVGLGLLAALRPCAEHAIKSSKGHHEPHAHTNEK